MPRSLRVLRLNSFAVSGRTTIAFPDVSAQIRPETLSFAAADTGIVEQNFDFDLLTPAKLIEKAIDKCRDVGNVVYSIVLKNS